MHQPKKYFSPRIAKEVKELIKELNLPNIFDITINEEWPKLRWKGRVKEEVREKCEKELKEKMKTLSKLEEFFSEDNNFETKNYLRNMNLTDARIKFKLKTKMINVKFNYMNDPINRATLWRCDSCQSAIDSQGHILWCPAYSELRQGKDIKNDKHLIEYIKKVLQIREKLQIIK